MINTTSVGVKNNVVKTTEKIITHLEIQSGIVNAGLDMIGKMKTMMIAGIAKETVVEHQSAALGRPLHHLELLEIRLIYGTCRMIKNFDLSTHSALLQK